MKRPLILPLLVLCLVLSATPALADRPTDESMMTMLKASGTVETIQAMMSKLLARAQMSMQARLPNLPEDAARIVNDEMHNGVQSIIKEILAKQMAFFADHMSQKEVDDLIAIYNSPAWQKQVEVSRQYVASEYSRMLRDDVPRMTREMVSRILARLKDEGYLDQREEGVL
ncbi:hypothetical protein BerOc1_00220 [Pseudodesulfovibrio hydrargyri]|uniref:DUF2059 domain-containing protein n=1 Tax=Pseudodesulfovibrio hydrargyri TaxID=2125990 RepID=A0A1J5N808_9BACT|nr:winged helix-turn-helix domain-containing protein [Pseudodesulfovibrio hydrargyri]OIQ51763.1 hypothetical protein BerOc1_00220 [Pseudodesulfovibrio hydrargyri]